MEKEDKITYREAIPQFFSALVSIWQYDKKFVILSALVMLSDLIPRLFASIATAKFNEHLISGLVSSYGLTILPLLFLILVNIVDYLVFGFYFWIQEKVTTKLTIRLLRRSVEKAASLDYASYDDHEFYDTISKGWAQDGTVLVQNMQSVWSTLSFVLGSLTYFSVLLWLDWRLLILLILLAIFYNPLSDLNWQLKYKLDQKYAEIRRKENYYRSFFDSKALSSEGKLSDFFDYAENNFRKNHQIIYRKSYEYAFKKKLVDLLGITVWKLPHSVVFIYLTIQVFNGSLSIANMVLYTTMFEGFLNMVYNTVGSVSNIKYYANTNRHVQEFMDMIGNIRTNKDEEKPAIDYESGHTIEFCNVTFRYPGTEKNILENISFRIKPGEIVSIIGANGAGKTTLIHLLMRLYDPIDGTILIDGRDIRSYSVESYYKLFGVLFQDYCSYSVNARESVTLSTDKADEIKINNALRASTAGKVIDELPFGLDTVLSRSFSEDGIELSGGQKQRVALARAYYKDAPILVLDEPSAAIDPISEAEILGAMKEQGGRKNVWIISHRLSSCVLSDRILLLSDGNIIGNGTHKELLNSCEEYARMFNLQAERYALGEEGEK